MDSPCADHVFTMFLAKGAAKAKGTSCKGDVLMRPSWILLPFIPRLVQRIGSETLIAGRLRVRPPVTHPRHSESSVNAQNGLDDPEQLSHTETACWSIT
jgi:hypothetical protein